MLNFIVEDPYELIKKLFILQNKGYVFRGHPNIQWKLQPRVFRLEGRDFLTNIYPEKDNTYHWYFGGEIRRLVYLWAKVYYNDYIPMGLRRIFDLYVFIMKYNFGLNKFLKSNADLIDPSHNKKLINAERDWGSENTFIDLVGNTLQHWLSIYSVDGSKISNPNPFEELTILEEPLAQHYGFPTAALDFSRNPMKALYFALINHFSPYFSIFAYKQIIEDNTIPTKIIENINPNNLRANKQEGCFVSFTKPCSYYVFKNKFPSINDFNTYQMYGLSEKYFEIERIDVPKGPSVISTLKQFLLNEGIDEYSLGLNNEQNEKAALFL